MTNIDARGHERTTKRRAWRKGRPSMDLELTDDRQLFHETTTRFIESELPISKVRELHDDPAGFDRGWLSKAAPPANKAMNKVTGALAGASQMTPAVVNKS